MNFQDVEQRFGQLKQQHDSGSLSDPDFDREREQLKTRDERGVWWTKGKAGDWYFHNGSVWVQGNPQLLGGHPSGPMPAATSYPNQVGDQQRNSDQIGAMAGVGIGSAILSLIFLPPLFGLLGILFGFIALKQGYRTWGVRVMIGSGVCMVVGMIIGAIVYTSLR